MGDGDKGEGKKKAQIHRYLYLLQSTYEDAYTFVLPLRNKLSTSPRTEGCSGLQAVESLYTMPYRNE